jgi:hypothetical protein
MSSAEIKGIKLNLIEWISKLSDVTILSFLEGLRNSSVKSDWWKELSESEKKQIIEGLKDAENGKLLGSKDFWSKLKNA